MKPVFFHTILKLLFLFFLWSVSYMHLYVTSKIVVE